MVSGKRPLLLLLVFCEVHIQFLYHPVKLSGQFSVEQYCWVTSFVADLIISGDFYGLVDYVSTSVCKVVSILKICLPVSFTVYIYAYSFHLLLPSFFSHSTWENFNCSGLITRNPIVLFFPISIGSLLPPPTSDVFH